MQKYSNHRSTEDRHAQGADGYLFLDPAQLVQLDADRSSSRAASEETGAGREQAA